MIHLVNIPHNKLNITPRHCGHCDSVAKVDVSERDQSAPEAV